MLLIYRGQSLQASVHAPKPDRQPIAVNWRYQIPGERYSNEIPMRPMRPVYKTPRVINWRWCVQG
jgi:hypothetical protein